jgi:hypothetical protein
VCGGLGIRPMWLAMVLRGGSCLRGLIQACESSMNLAKASPPSLVPKRMKGDKYWSALWRCWVRASWNRTQWKSLEDDMGRGLQGNSATLAAMWVGGMRAVMGTIFPCKHVFSKESDGSTEHCRGALAIPIMKSGGAPEGWWCKAQYAGFLRGSSSHTCSHSRMACWREETRRASMEGTAMFRSGGAAIAASTASVWRHLRGWKLAAPGIQRSDSEVDSWSRGCAECLWPCHIWLCMHRRGHGGLSRFYLSLSDYSRYLKITHVGITFATKFNIDVVDEATPCRWWTTQCDNLLVRCESGVLL